MHYITLNLADIIFKVFLSWHNQKKWEKNRVVLNKDIKQKFYVYIKSSI